MSCFYFPKIFSFMHMYHIHRYIWKLESFIFFNNVHYRSKNLKSRTKYMNRPYIQYMLHKTPSQNSQVPLSSKFVHFTVENFPFQVGLCYFTFGNCT